MAKRILKILKWGSVCIITISSLVGIIAFVMERFEKSNDHKPYGIYEKYVKRPLDAFLATGALIVFSPVLLVTAILIWINIGSPVIFKQDRPGRNEKVFKLYKFRTMTNERDKEGNLLSDEERLTPFGKKIRETSLDELPELINIIKGDMAVVGPRPLLVKYLGRYNGFQARRHEVRPGITGLAQINGRNSISWNERFEWDVKYINQISFCKDLSIIKSTIKVVLDHDGINAAGEATMPEFLGSKQGN